MTKNSPPRSDVEIVELLDAPERKREIINENIDNQSNCSWSLRPLSLSHHHRHLVFRAYS